MTDARKSLPGLPAPGQPQISERNLRRLARNLEANLHPGAPERVRRFAREHSQIQRASERLCDDIKVTGSALPDRKALGDIPLDATHASEAAKAHRQVMISDLSAVIRFLHSHPHIEDAYAATLGRLMVGLQRVEDGWSFYVFEPSNEKDRLPVGDVAAVLRAAMAAAVDCHMSAGDKNETACKAVAKRMEGCEPTDFGFAAGTLIDWKQIQGAREEISAGRLKSYKQPIKWRGEETTPRKLYQNLKGIAQERGRDGPGVAREYAEMLLRGAIERSGRTITAEKPED